MADAEKSAINEGTSARLREIAESYALASGQVSNLADNVKKVGEEAAPAEDALAKLSKTAETTGEKSAKAVASSFGDTFKGIAEGTKTASAAFTDMANTIISRLFDILVVERMVQSIAGNLKSTKLFGGAPATPPKGNAIGGSVQRGVPTIVGERGAELFVPASSGSIVPNNKMGGGGVTVNQTVNISTGVAQTVRAEMVQLLPQVVNAAKAGVLDAKKRGGAYGSAF